MSALTGKSWREVYDELTRLAGNDGLMFDRVEFVEDYLDDRYPRECHYSKTVGEFAKEFPYGKYAVTMDGHITAVVNGTVIDTFNPSNRKRLDISFLILTSPIYVPLLIETLGKVPTKL